MPDWRYPMRDSTESVIVWLVSAAALQKTFSARKPRAFADRACAEFPRCGVTANEGSATLPTRIRAHANSRGKQ